MEDPPVDFAFAEFGCFRGRRMLCFSFGSFAEVVAGSVVLGGRFSEVSP